MIVVSVCLPSDALSVPTVLLGFSYLGRGVSLHSCSSKVQPLLLPLTSGISSQLLQNPAAGAFSKPQKEAQIQKGSGLASHDQKRIVTSCLLDSRPGYNCLPLCSPFSLNSSPWCFPSLWCFPLVIFPQNFLWTFGFLVPEQDLTVISAPRELQA